MLRNEIIESALLIQNAIRSIPRSALPSGELRHLVRFLQTKGISLSTSSKNLGFDSENHQWMQQVVQKKLNVASIKKECSDHPEISDLARIACSKSLNERKKAIAVLAKLKGISTRSIQRFLKGSQKTIQQYWKKFQSGGTSKLFMGRNRPKQADNAAFRSTFYSLLHSPPSAHGINRTTWKWDDLLRCLREQGCPSNKDTLRAIIKADGFKWRKARVVLTSHDPEYREKIDAMKKILANLGVGERFFSVDEFGPFSIKMKGGRRLVGPNEYPEIPQFQTSKGCVIITAALELSRNQVTHFYSKKKNTLEMLKLLELLVKEYDDCKKLYFSWDAASWHASELLYDTVRYHNAMSVAEGCHLPIIELVPLPASAQFLNVIESIFSGMAKAIIHNSDYPSENAAEGAIDRYFKERNEHFLKNPKKAGNKIWGQERVPPVFAEDQNCKDPKWR